MRLAAPIAAKARRVLARVLPRRRLTQWVVGGALALTLVGVGATAVGAAPWGGFGWGGGAPKTHHQMPAIVGMVATAPASSTGSFTVTAWKNATWTVDLSASTTYSEWAVSSPTYANIGVGDEVVVFGTSAGSNTIDATSVVIIRKPVVVGKVATAPASSSGSFTVTAWKDVTWTVDLSGSTTYSEQGVSSPTYANIGVGDEVVVFGTSAGSNTVDATSVVIIQKPVVVGKVATAPASSSGSFTVTACKDVTWTVDLSASTTYSERGVSPPTYANVLVGDEVVVYGTSAGSNTVDATSVVILSKPPNPVPSPASHPAKPQLSVVKPPAQPSPAALPHGYPLPTPPATWVHPDPSWPTAWNHDPGGRWNGGGGPGGRRH
ncbi:MAG TPA: DUF5666 domain-containing protein [Candidatus Binatia bacterium]|nr:DUF5666 domain-containing protein [Candidatus Binatia bacterium]